ncbi:MAG: DJ-1/PfpI family protein [Acidiferrobacterales bacterium]|nr:DJ-1/PfpI family protein [Acidiferrobacterales bacterium]
MPRVLVPLAEGFEELEAVTITDLLTRAKIEVVTAGLDPGPVKASRGTTLIPTTDLESALQQEYDMIVLPGGQPGANNLQGDNRILSLLKTMSDKGKVVAAICAAPKALAAAGVLDNRNATCFPGSIDTKRYPAIRLTDDVIVVDDNIVTSRGPGTAMDFTLALVERLTGAKIRNEVEAGLQRPKAHLQH